MAKKKLTESAANLGKNVDKDNTPKLDNESSNPANGYSNDPETDHKTGRRMVSAWVDVDVWSDIRHLAKYRAAKGIKNHLGQPMSAGRLLEDALISYVDAHREELDRWKAFLAGDK